MNKKIPVKSALGALAGLHFLSFLIFYIPNFVVTVNNVDAATYVVQFLGHVFKFVLPLIAATVVFLACYKTFKKVIATVAILSISSLAYNFLYYYLMFLSYGNDSIEASLISLGVSALEYLLFSGLTLLFWYIMRLATVRAARREAICDLPKAYREKPTKEMLQKIDLVSIDELPTYIAKSRATDVTSPVTIGVFFACLTQFAFQLIYTLTGIILNLIEYMDYSTAELIYIIVVLLFIFAELFASHFACYLTKHILMKGDSDDGNDEAVGE